MAMVVITPKGLYKMSEFNETFPSDPTSYISPDGDVLPIADIEEAAAPEVEVPERSDDFILATHIIEEGIAKSKAGGYANLKVEFWVQDDSAKGGHEVSMSLSQFFGGNSLRKMVSEEEFKELFAKYGQESEQFSASRAHKFGGAVIESGQKRYRDFRSAAAGDYLDDDE